MAKTIRGQAVTSLKVSTDGTTGNLKELKTNLLQTLTYNDGKRTQERTRGGDVNARHESVKADPSFELTFDPDVETDLSYDVLHDASGGDPRAFEFSIASSQSASDGIKVTGIGQVQEGVLTYESATGDAMYRVRITSAGSAWTESTSL